MELDHRLSKSDTSLQQRQHFLLCLIGTQVYGFAIEQVREVLTRARSHPTPVDLQGIKGLIAIRGHICPLVDVGLCLPVTDEGLNQPGSCLIVCEVNDYRFCIHVNRVIHVVDQSAIEWVHDSKGNQSQLIPLVAHISEDLVLIVDLGVLIQHIRPIGSEVCCH